MRIDRLFCYLRFARTRSLSHRLIDEGHIRRNGVRVCRASQPVAVGDVLTFPWGSGVLVIELLALPARRGSPAEAQSFYRMLDQQGQTAIAPDNSLTASDIQD
ncbi:RNA-binding S4 domain-containing protein [Altererythrobacter confluentis]|uniref:RNA-binding S4 domain-containing protein n=1 Tax=Allopontixanthobacter confluentis TaxID=1849021 RepID=A0A6L7GI04_9SPHN|nr:S4 domain-containing protein [Allopontixanthobacter confluentis]MXP15200.1 RNA-binding S4 domain-containing protein [Allopontixanthobacter confluentis]